MVRKHPKSAFKCPKRHFSDHLIDFWGTFFGRPKLAFFGLLKCTFWNSRISGSVWGRDDRNACVDNPLFLGCLSRLRRVFVIPVVFVKGHPHASHGLANHSFRNPQIYPSCMSWGWFRRSHPSSFGVWVCRKYFETKVLLNSPPPQIQGFNLPEVL